MILALGTSLAFGLPSLDAVYKIAVFLLMISVLVVLHEGGHFLLARLNGVRVNDFAVGFGPTLVKWTSKRSGTNYRINLLPIGGYCAMQGEDGQTSEAEQQRQFLATATDPAKERDLGGSFQAKNPWQRLSIIVAGPVANFVLAYFILVIGAVAFGVPSNETTTRIGPVIAGQPGAKAGLAIGDRIVSIDGVTYALNDGDKLVQKIHNSANKPLQLTYERHGELTTVTVTPAEFKDPQTKKSVGRIGFSPVPIYQRMAFVQAITGSASMLVDMVQTQVAGIGQLIANPVAHYSEVSGPIGMERAAATYQDIGWGPYLQLAAMISLALGIFNLLPVPALDGGRGVFIIAELLRGRPVDAEKEAVVHVAGFAVLMALIALVAYHDIANIISGKGVF